MNSMGANTCLWPPKTRGSHLPCRSSSRMRLSRFSYRILSIVPILGTLLLLAQQAPQAPRPFDPWPGKKKLLAIADPEEWYRHPNYHHDSASHTLATVERLGRESGAWVTVIRTDMELLRKAKIEGTNVRTLDQFDGIFY